MKEVRDIILEETQYKSKYTEETNKMVISASMVADEPLEIFLKLIYGVQPATDIDESTFGSIMHKGMESIIESYIEKTKPKEVIYLEYPLVHDIDDDWILTGTADMVVYEDDLNAHIYDWKVTKNYTTKMIEKEGKMHRYAIQLAALRYLLYENNKKVVDIYTHLGFFLKDSNKLMKVPSYKEAKVETMGTGDFTKYLKSKLSIVMEHIKNATTPPQGEDLWWRKIKGNNIPTRCELYCGYRDVCPYYKGMNPRAAAETALDW